MYNIGYYVSPGHFHVSAAEQFRVDIYGRYTCVIDSSRLKPFINFLCGPTFYPGHGDRVEGYSPGVGIMVI